MKIKETTDKNEKMTFFDDGSAIIIARSPRTGKYHKAMMILTAAQYSKWKVDHMLIQDAMPHLDKDEREFLMTGYTPEDWSAIFPPEEDEEDEGE